MGVREGVCMYVCNYVMYVCMHECVYICMNGWMGVSYKYVGMGGSYGTGKGEN